MTRSYFMIAYLENCITYEVLFRLCCSLRRWPQVIWFWNVLEWAVRVLFIVISSVWLEATIPFLPSILGGKIKLDFIKCNGSELIFNGAWLSWDAPLGIGDTGANLHVPGCPGIAHSLFPCPRCRMPANTTSLSSTASISLQQANLAGLTTCQSH